MKGVITLTQDGIYKRILLQMDEIHSLLVPLPIPDKGPPHTGG